MKKAVLALDQGTTSSRAILFDHDGRTLAVARREFTQHYPKSGWVEHDPDEIWSSQISVAAEAMARAGLAPADLAGIGITNQRETTLLWDRRTGRPVHPAIVWQDRRSAAACDALRAKGVEGVFRKRTGLVLDPYFSGTKLAWLLEHVSDARARAERGELAFGTVDTWLLWQLTGGRVHATDPSNASRTLLYNIHAHLWDDELLRLLDIPRAVLPEVRPSSGTFGTATVAALAGVPIAGIAGDQQAALFGQACFEPGMAKNTYGTGCFLLLNTGTRPVESKNKLLTTVAWTIDGRTEYALEGSVFMGGAVVQWLRDEMKLIPRSAAVEPLAASVPDAGGVVLVPAFAGLGAPYWDPYARGTLVGMTRGTGAAHLARAALESIALQSHDVLRAMERDAGFGLKELRVDGGACANDLLMQIQADLLQVPVIRPANTETTAFGAACLAGLATGFWRDRAELASRWRAERRFAAAQSPDAVRPVLRRWERAVALSRDWAREP
ncbi:MAG: glycerol kinase GlpK [Opitutaceae bacterium]|nr:glycerol kinase GlpK [Opitutaceae bacterium]